MTREEQKQIRESKLSAKIAAREAKKQAKLEEKAWYKMVERLKAKGAWIEG